ncbi:MAG: hypothetical protein CVV10_00675 [Gammaproteobacteria bacterium HGW-Gammaproteobacteria-14]|nr:MAG: hypothetical protein CVV10_00675 [Gammaproteobacteria bacterium HGW-Gammaproteobacteria-14]
MGPSAVTSEAVLFFDNRGVVKSMLFSDFEAILDGMVGVPEFAGEQIKGAYCLVNGRLQALGVVLFLIDFDDDGMADHTWNVPVRHLAEHGGPGPDMGAGPIRLSCRSQCPVAWHQEKLWDPTMKPGSNHFVFIRDTLRERGSKMGLYIDDNPVAAPQAAQAFPPATVVPASAPPVPPMVQPDPVPVMQPERSAQPAEVKDDKERIRLARTLKELRLRVQTMENKHSEEVDQLRYAHQTKEEILSTQLEKVLMQFKTLKSQNSALREQTDSLKAQVVSLNHSLEEQISSSHEHGSEIELLTEQYKVALEQRLDEERARLSEELHAREMETLNRDEQISALKAELAEARHDQIRMANSGAEKLLEKLQSLGLNFIAFHPGAGHISINANEISDYMQNPLAFAARKCLVTEEHYRAWLRHYENPICQVEISGQPCGKRVIRVDVPTQFRPGQSDRNANRCQHCRVDTAIENVLKFR